MNQDNQLTNVDIYAGIVIAVNTFTTFITDNFDGVEHVEPANEELLTNVKTLFETLIANTFTHRTEDEHTELALSLRNETIERIMNSIGSK